MTELNAPRQPRGASMWPLALMLLATILCICLSILIGGGEIGPDRTLAYLLGRPDALSDEHLKTVVTTIRIPRTIAATLIGLSLGVAGTLMQAVTRNPLAETGLLGVNAGAALGVVVGLTYLSQSQNGYAYLLWAFAGALVASLIVLLLANATSASVSPLRLLLAGTALGATFRGLTSYILVTDAVVFDQYRFWALGSIVGVTTERALEVLPAIVLGLIIALLVARPLSALSLGDDAARALGHRPDLIRTVVAIAVTLLAASGVALAGPISFLGLIAPHVARAIAGPRLLHEIGLAGTVGAAVLLVADILGRVVIRPYEAPVNVLLALVGGPLLLLIARSPRSLTLHEPR